MRSNLNDYSNDNDIKILSNYNSINYKDENDFISSLLKKDD
jgi:hypothetical protein